MLAMRNSLSPNAETINRYNSVIRADRRLEMRFMSNLWSKPEPEVFLAAILTLRRANTSTPAPPS